LEWTLIHRHIYAYILYPLQKRIILGVLLPDPIAIRCKTCIMWQSKLLSFCLHESFTAREHSIWRSLNWVWQFVQP
jgi:hypothetical protein